MHSKIDKLLKQVLLHSITINYMSLLYKEFKDLISNEGNFT